MSLLDTIKGVLPKFGKGTPEGTAAKTGSTPAEDEALKKFQTDLNLQNLLVLGAEFKPDDIIDLRRRARYGDCRFLHALYDEMSRLGPAPQISKMRMAMKNTQSSWHATPEDFDDDEAKENEAQAARLIRDVCEESWGKWLPTMKSHHSTKFLYGFQAMQVVVEPRGIAGRFERVVDVRPIPSRRFRLDPSTRKFLFLPQPTSWDGVPVEDLVAKGQLFWAETGADVEPLDQRGLLSQCLIPWAIHQYIVRWRAKRMEIYGLPPRVVTYKTGSPEGKKTAEAVAAMLGSAGWAAVPDTIKAELLQIPTGRGIDPYEAAIEWCVRTYDQLILGHSQASGVQVGAGSRTSSESATEMAKDLINARSTEFDDDFEDGPLTLYVKRNFGAQWADTSTPHLMTRMIERDDATQLSTVAMNLQKAGCAGVIDAVDIATRCGMEIANDGDVTMAGNVKGEEPPAPPVTESIVPPAAPGESAQAPGTARQLPAGQGVPATSTAKQPKQLPGKTAAGAQGKAAPQPGPRGAVPKAKVKMGVPMGPTGEPARSGLRKKARRQEILAKRQRFSVAASAERPRVNITSFGYDNGEPPEADALVDVRSMSPAGYDPATSHFPNSERTGLDPAIAKVIEDHPRTGVIMGGVKTAVQRAISAAQLNGSPECNVAIGCNHGRHRSVYVAERLGEELRADKHDVTVTHRDAYDAEALESRLPGATQLAVAVVSEQLADFADASERFYSEDQPRDDKGRFEGSGNAESAKTKEQHTAAAAHHASEAKRAYAKHDNTRGNLHTLAAGAHRIAATPGSDKKQAAFARGLSAQAHSGEFGPRGTYGAEEAESFMTEHQPRAQGAQWAPHTRSAGYHRDKAEAATAEGDHGKASLHEKAAAAHDLAAYHDGDPRAAALAHAASALAHDNQPIQLAVSTRIPVKDEAFRQAQTQAAARVRARLKAQHAIVLKMVEEKLNKGATS
jgi:phage gp29-like protein